MHNIQKNIHDLNQKISFLAEKPIQFWKKRKNEKIRLPRKQTLKTLQDQKYSLECLKVGLY